MVSRAINSVLGQDEIDLELVVVNDGSTDETESVLASVNDPRVIVLNRKNGGLSAARNAGIAQASGEWITFLDDDDMALPAWLKGLSELVGDDAGIVCCGARYRSQDGIDARTVVPRPMGPLYDYQVGSHIAGTFAVRAELLRAVGGYDERMTCSHQSELLMRLIPAMLARELVMRSTESILIVCESRPATERPMSSPLALYQGTRVLLEKHSERISRYPKSRAVYNGILGVSAARLGRWREARSALLTAAVSEPLRVQNWLRLSGAIFPAIGRRMWDVASYESHTARE